MKRTISLLIVLAALLMLLSWNVSGAGEIPQLPKEVRNHDIEDDKILIEVDHQEKSLGVSYLLENAEGDVLRITDPKEEGTASGTMELLSHWNVYGDIISDVCYVPFSSSFTCRTEPLGKDVGILVGCEKGMYYLNARGVETVTFSVDGLRFTGEDVSYSLHVVNDLNWLEILGEGESELCLLREGENFALTAAHPCEVNLRRDQGGTMKMETQSCGAYQTLFAENLGSDSPSLRLGQ